MAETLQNSRLNEELNKKLNKELNKKLNKEESPMNTNLENGDLSLLVVQKYGGSSVATPEKIKNVALRIKNRIQISEQTSEQGEFKMAVVVSAMGKTTDELIALAKEVSSAPSPREMDMLLATGEQVSAALLAMALQDLGVAATSRNAFQLGIETTGHHSNARIRDIDLSLLRRSFEENSVVVITGFQGVTPNGDLTTLGRGGSDTSAVAIAAKAVSSGLEAVCEIYSDVPGIFTCDPNKVPGARKLDYITYAEMLELASLGAKVLHMRSVELARKYGVTLYCASTFSEERGTYVVKELPEWMENPVVTGVTVARGQMKFLIKRIRGNGDMLSEIFQALASAGANLDMISTAGDDELSFLTLSVMGSDANAVIQAVSGYMKKNGEEGWSIGPGVPVAKVSVVGDGMNAVTGVAGRVLLALRAKDIAILGISTSDINISVLVEESQADAAVALLAEAFALTDIL
ncbi:MAG: aspartate kinase [Synergistaceae bacterium]|jgi:aspartate kinase|nr:aspartate kinase [Synergistaceae bacterium]